MIPSDHIKEWELVQFRAGRLAADRTVEIAGHLEVCRSCAERFASTPAPAWSGLPHDPEVCLRDNHPEIDLMGEYLEGEIDVEERELIEVHVRGCRACAEDLNSLRSLRIEAEPAMAKRYFESRALTRVANLIPRGGILRPTLAVVTLILMAWGLAWFLSSRKGPEAPIVKLPPKAASTPEPVKTDDVAPPEEEKPEYLVAIVDGGRRVGLDSEGRLIGFGRIPPGLRGDVALALRGESLRRNSELEELKTPDGVARSAPGEAEPLKLVGPVATLVREARPSFRWTRQDGATGYVVTVVDDRFNEVAASGRLAGTEWVPEAGLERGRVYQWQVTAFKGELPVESRLRQVGLFRVIGDGELNSIEKAEAGVDSALVRAVLYANTGLMEEAEIEMKKLERGVRSEWLRARLRRAIIPLR